MDIKLSGVTERDMDLMLIEELASSSFFLHWFLRKVGATGKGRFKSIGHSVRTSSGETDIELEVVQGADSVKILIENKVDARFQPRQAQRYKSRSRQYKKTVAMIELLLYWRPPRSILETVAIHSALIPKSHMKRWSTGSERQSKLADGQHISSQF
jgi:hypothetical protein